MSTGYIYCMTNPSMPGMVKVGMTARTPEARLYEANSSDTWKPPTSYAIEFAKKVSNPKQKETTIHTLLSKYTERIHAKREFFRVSPDAVKMLFDLIDGDFWVIPSSVVLEPTIKVMKRDRRVCEMVQTINTSESQWKKSKWKGWVIPA